MPRALIAAALIAWLNHGCGERLPEVPTDPVLADLHIDQVTPGLVLPGTSLAIGGTAFVDTTWGTSTLRITGTTTSATAATSVDLRWPAEFFDASTLRVSVDRRRFSDLGGDGARLRGALTVEVLSAVNGVVYTSNPTPIDIELRSELGPRLDHIVVSGPMFPNEPIPLRGDGLLAEGEGTSLVRVSGCFAATGTNRCIPIPPRERPVELDAWPSRTAGHFVFSPEIAGIEPGQFRGDIVLVNRMASGRTLEDTAVPCTYDLQPPVLYGTSTQNASLGQYVFVNGAGFVGGDDATTLLEFAGTFMPDDGAAPVTVSVDLLPDFSDGHTIRYAVNEDDAIGRAIDVRYRSGLFSGSITPITQWGMSEVAGDPAAFSFHLDRVRQIVWLNFADAYVESLRAFGLRAVDRFVRARVFEVVRRDFATLAVDFRDTIPTDYALYSQVDIGGPDINGLGLLGYDNTPGKDTGNLRLYDKIGGLNAVTQANNYPGFGGIFIESLLGYSATVAPGVVPIYVDDDFDDVFDPFRPAAGGRPVIGNDIFESDLDGIAPDQCPNLEGDRPSQLRCAIWALGSTIGTIVSHELGHSLGLADPYGPNLHNPGDEPNRLMDSDRPFAERAELHGAGPSRFCADEYEYLRKILPLDVSPDPTLRPSCD